MSKKPKRGKPADARVFTLQVDLIGGPIPDDFRRRNRRISRTIQCAAGQTLDDLHRAIFDAFDRWEADHLYEFQMSDKQFDPGARIYTAMPEQPVFGGPTPKLTAGARLGQLGLKVGDRFLYWFDFGDDWWHRIKVLGIERTAGDGEYPQTIKSVGESPQQYIWQCPLDEDDEDLP